MKGRGHMFCEKCGSQLPQDAEFCTNCGANVHQNVKVQEKIVDNEVQLNVKPTFKTLYMIISELTIFAIIILICAPMMVLLLYVSEKYILGFYLSCCILTGVMYLIWLVLRKKQYDNYSFDFYKTKVIYKDGFLNKTQKEVKYKHIREIVMRQSFFQRFFNLGNIVLYTNAETGYGNGINILNVEDVNDVYKKIKDIIDV